MPIGFRIQPTEWGTHESQVKRARGTVCFGALAAHFRTDSPKLIEWRADRRAPYNKSGDPSASNKYLRWRQGTRLPNDDTVAHIRARTAGAVNLDFWRDLPLWPLLAPEAPRMSWILRMLEKSPVNIRQILFGDEDGRWGGRFHHAKPTRVQLLGIRNLYSLDAFLALLCLARKGEELEDDPLHFLSSACAFDIFPRILYSYPPLRYRWEGLFICIERLFWNRVYLNGIYYKFPIEVIRDNLRELDLDPSTRLPQMSGSRIRPARDSATGSDVFA